MEVVTKTKSGVEAILKGKPCDDISIKIPQGEFKGYWGKLGTAEGFTCNGKINGKDTQICAQIPRADWDKFIIGIKLELEKNVPGLYILNSAINDEIDYRKNFDRMMEDEQNDGVNPPVEPQNKSADVAKQYPVAAAYLKAGEFEFSNNYMKSAAGAKAKRIIGQGGDYIKAIEEMEKEWGVFFSVSEFMEYLHKDEYVEFRENLEALIQERDNEIYIAKIIVSEGHGCKGIGTKYILELIEYAKKYNKQLRLIPSSAYGSNLRRLKKFYKRLGFRKIGYDELRYFP